jgi:uncharacterized protein (DUF1800 family)
MPLPEFTGTLGVKRAAHLLRRATFGATKTQIDVYAQLTPAQAIDQLFRVALPDPVEPIDPVTGQSWVLTLPSETGSDEDDLQKYFKRWFLAQMMSAGIDPGVSLAFSAREKIVLFFHTHFTCIQSKVGSSRWMYYQNQTFRLFARDAINPLQEVNIKGLTVKISVDNAMLRLLDGDLNVKGSPNENYARELLELFSIGRGLEGSLPATPEQGDYLLYTEQDVQSAAKVLSGWEVNDDDVTTRDQITNFPRGRVKGDLNNASAHDNDLKQFSARFNNAIIQANPALMNGGKPTEASALDEIRQLIDLIYSKNETAKNICWKLYRYFVYAPHTQDTALTIDNAIINEMATTLIANNYKIQPVIENLLRSEHFYEANAGVADDNFGGIIKSPIDLVIGTLRAFHVSLPDMQANTTAFYEATEEINSTIEALGMNFYEPYDVAGYEAYHQYPIYHRNWITPNYLANRYNFIRSVISASEQMMFNVNVYQYVKNNFPDATASNARELIIALAQYFLPVTDNLTFDGNADDNASLTAQRLNYFKDRFLQQFDETYWTTRWNEGALDLRDQLEFLFNAMLQSPEYQLA